MSVERRGDNNFSTVQRRGEKKTVLPNRDYVQPKPEALKTEGLREQLAALPKADYKIKIAPADKLAFERRVEQRIAELEASPTEKKAFLKKVDGWIGKVIFAVIFTFAIPPLAGLVISIFIFYLFLMSLRPKDPNRTQRMQQIAEDIAVGIKLKQGGK